MSYKTKSKLFVVFFQISLIRLLFLPNEWKPQREPVAPFYCDCYILEEIQAK